MTQRHYRQTGKESFFGRMVYDRIVPTDHFLMRLDRLIPWSRFSEKLIAYYKGEGVWGAPPFDPVVLLKMLLLAYLYKTSEREVEEFVTFNLVAKCFVGLAVDEAAPDHATLSTFKTRLLQRGQLEPFEMLLAEIVGLAQEAGIAFGPIQVLDSVHVVADVNTEKDDKRSKGGKGRRDKDAAWGVKHTKKVKDAQGQEHKQKEYFYGYKQHVSMNAKAGLITHVTHTPGNAYDGHQLPELVRADLADHLPITTVTADKAYDDGDNHTFLEDHHLASAIRLNDYRTDKKDAHKEPWLKLKARPSYKAGLAQRYTIERKFGEAKTQHLLRRCRYLGLDRFSIQGYLTAAVLNLKRLVLLLTGTPFRNGRAAPMAA